MKKHVYKLTREDGREFYDEIDVVDAEPECGEHFCDRCGDCLSCYGFDPCWATNDAQEHLWIEYKDD